MPRINKSSLKPPEIEGVAGSVAVVAVSFIVPLVLGKLLSLKVISCEQARRVLSWRHSGFSVDNRVRIYDDQARVKLAEYALRAPLSLKKISYDLNRGRWKEQPAINRFAPQGWLDESNSLPYCLSRSHYEVLD